MDKMRRLLDIMRRLRDPEGGCPWDVAQTFATIAPYTIEEAYEVVDAIDRHDMAGLRDELGDLLFQVIFHSQMADEAGAFDFTDVVEAVCEKMERRHPHVFGDASIDSAQAQAGAWESIKAQERDAQGSTSALDGIAAGLPEWQRASKLHGRAARVGFDWPHWAAVLEKVREETDELSSAAQSEDSDAVHEELGDLLFSVLALARHLKLDAGSALRAANRKFEARFRALEAKAGGQALADMSAEQLDHLWEQVKDGEADL